MPDSIMPPNVVDFVGLAHQMRSMGNGEASYQYLCAAARTNPTPRAWSMLGQSLRELGRMQAASIAFRKGEMDDHRTLVCLGSCHHLLGEYEEAEKHLRKAVELASPDDPLPLTDLSQCVIRLGRYDEALELAERAAKVAKEPSHAIAHAMALFAKARWAEGFRIYEARIPFKLQTFLNYPYPRWQGEKTNRLLIQAEMGLGDTLLMLRYIPDVLERVDSLILYIHPELTGLGRRWAKKWPQVEVYGMPKELPQVDAFTPMLSIPVALGIGQPKGEPYLDTVMKPSLSDKLRIGIVWSSSPTSDEARWRDVPVMDFMPLFERDDIELHSLQHGEASGDIGRFGLHALLWDRLPEITSMADTQEIIGGLDMVVTCDSAIAHLCGAMGKRVFMLRNQKAAPWIWGWGDGPTPWYDSMEIVTRSHEETSWVPAVQRVLERIDRGD